MQFDLGLGISIVMLFMATNICYNYSLIVLCFPKLYRKSFPSSVDHVYFKFKDSK